jgi:hypothetical protein
MSDFGTLASYAPWLDDGPLNLAVFMVLMGLDFIYWPMEPCMDAKVGGGE